MNVTADDIYLGILSELSRHEEAFGGYGLIILLNPQAYAIITASTVVTDLPGIPFLFGYPVRVTEQKELKEPPRFWICREGIIWSEDGCVTHEDVKVDVLCDWCAICPEEKRDPTKCEIEAINPGLEVDP